MNVWSGAESLIPPQTFFGCGDCDTCKRNQVQTQQSNATPSVLLPTRDFFSSFSYDDQRVLDTRDTVWQARGIVGSFSASFLVTRKESMLFIECVTNDWWLLLDTSVAAVIAGCLPKLCVDMCKRAHRFLNWDLERKPPPADAVSAYHIIKKYTMRHLQTQQGGIAHYRVQRIDDGFKVTHTVWPEVFVEIFPVQKVEPVDPESLLQYSFS